MCDTVTNPTDRVLGVDIGGTGIKGGLVNLETGTLDGERFRLDTPEGATPEGVAETVAQIAEHFEHTGRVGITFPGVVEDGVAKTAANVDPSWIGASLKDIIGARLPGDVVFVNDADAAGLAEVRYGVGQGHRGVVVLITFGTGIGSAVIHDGRLVPNSEFGHIEIDGQAAEKAAAASAIKREGLSWEDWAARASRYLRTLENLIWPELIILGGGISKKPDQWLPLLENRTPLVIAELRNSAGIVGAALVAHEAAH